MFGDGSFTKQIHKERYYYYYYYNYYTTIYFKDKSPSNMYITPQSQKEKEKEIATIN
jgi:hypothetical protein